jgi:hypothetical protein
MSTFYTADHAVSSASCFRFRIIYSNMTLGNHRSVTSSSELNSFLKYVFSGYLNIKEN